MAMTINVPLHYESEDRVTIKRMLENLIPERKFLIHPTPGIDFPEYDEEDLDDTEAIIINDILRGFDDG